MTKNSELVLVVDDSPDTLELVKRILSAQGFQVAVAAGVEQALERLEAHPADLVITDIKMPGADGFDLLRHVRENYKDIALLVMTGFPALDEAVKAVKYGAEEYLVKPFTDSELISAAARALETLRLRRKAEGAGATLNGYGLIGESPPMLQVFKEIAKAAAIPATVLIQGESGTGKELVARAIHYHSPRAVAPFVPVNCGSIPEQLIESELFGHVKGAFTGATSSRAGFFQSAEKGTVFLDEISEASPAMQVKLLRVLQDKEICMVGSSRTAKINIRIMAATNKDLAALVTQDLFRDDLFYRLNVVTITLPPLRERGDDMVLLASHFLGKFAKEMGRATPAVSDDAWRVLRSYQWPGNVRELENTVQRLVAMSEGEVIDLPDLPSLMRFSAARSQDLTRSLAQVEEEYIRSVLESVDQNKTRAAQILGIDRKTLRQKLNRN